MSDLENLQRLALEECTVALMNKLDVSSILPYLIAQHLLTTGDKEALSLCTKTQVEKSQHLLNIMPRKENGWFNKFLQCLRDSMDGTGHGELVIELETKLQELVEKDRQKPKKPHGLKKLLKLGKESSYEETQQPVGGGPRSGSTDDNKYTIFLESSGAQRTFTFQVKATDTVGSLMDKVRNRLNIGHFHGIRLITGSKELKLANSLQDSNVVNNSLVTMVLTTHGGHKKT